MTNKTKELKKDEDGLIYAEAPFAEAKEALEDNGYRIISLEENAILRMQEGKSSFVSQYGNRTKEGIIYLPNGKIFLTKNYFNIIFNPLSIISLYSLLPSK